MGLFCVSLPLLIGTSIETISSLKIHLLYTVMLFSGAVPSPFMKNVTLWDSPQEVLYPQKEMTVWDIP